MKTKIEKCLAVLFGKSETKCVSGAESLKKIDFNGRNSRIQFADGTIRNAKVLMALNDSIMIEEPGLWPKISVVAFRDIEAITYSFNTPVSVNDIVKRLNYFISHKVSRKAAHPA